MQAAEPLRPTPLVLAVVVGAPLLLTAFALGFGSDVVAWCAPWTIVGAAPFVAGRRLALPVVLALASVALLAGAPPLAGLVAGAVAGALAERGARPLVALPAVLPVLLVALAALAAAFA
jgi:hypothetical protein